MSDTNRDDMAGALGAAVKLAGFQCCLQGQPELGMQLARWFADGDFRRLALAFEGMASGAPKALATLDGGDGGRMVN